MLLLRRDNNYYSYNVVIYQLRVLTSYVIANVTLRNRLLQYRYYSVIIYQILAVDKTFTTLSSKAVHNCNPPPVLRHFFTSIIRHRAGLKSNSIFFEKILIDRIN